MSPIPRGAELDHLPAYLDIQTGGPCMPAQLALLTLAGDFLRAGYERFRLGGALLFLALLQGLRYTKRTQDSPSVLDFGERKIGEGGIGRSFGSVA